MERLREDKKYSNLILEKKKKEAEYLDLNIKVEVEDIFEFKLYFKNFS